MAEAPLVYYEPDEIVVGTSASWLLNLPYYLPADGWVVTYGFVSASQKSTTITGSDNGDGCHLIALATTDTGSWIPDLMYYEAFAAQSTSGQRVKVREGRLTVAPDLSAQAASYDNRSHVKKVLDAINALLEGRAGKDVDSYTVNGRSLVKMKPPELLAWKSKYEGWYQLELNAEKVKRGDNTGRKIRTRFNATSRPAGFGRMRGR